MSDNRQDAVRHFEEGVFAFEFVSALPEGRAEMRGDRWSVTGAAEHVALSPGGHSTRR